MDLNSTVAIPRNLLQHEMFNPIVNEMCSGALRLSPVIMTYAGSGYGMTVGVFRVGHNRFSRPVLDARCSVVTDRVWEMLSNTLQ